jgi:MoaA/NifB/PqqE/SkfB family radical SAM enzyme
MPFKHAERWLEQLTEHQPLTSLTIHGGEPFLNLELLTAILGKAPVLDIEQRWVITNGFWARSKSIAEENLERVKDAGLSCITFSVDAFHQEYTPLQNVKIGLDAAVHTGFDTVAVDSYIVGSENTENEFNAITYRLINSLQAYDTIRFSQYPVAFEGRAAHNLVQCVPSSSEVPSGGCTFPFWLGGDLKNPEGIEIDAEGNVTLCPGLCIGNVLHQSVAELLDSYAFAEHPLIHVLAEHGPSGLLTLAKTKGYKDHREFINECHLCYEMRKFLRKYYPDECAPSNCY